MDNFEIVIEAEYADEMERKVQEVLDKKLPDYVRNKVLIIKLRDLV